MNRGLPQTGKRTEECIVIHAPADAVWRALTDAQELCNWFPLEAKVDARAGGSIWMSWGQPWVGAATITVWQPGRHFTTLQDLPGRAGDPLVVDYYLENAGDQTVLRLVHSGFNTGSDREDEYYEAVCQGWQFELRGLRHYLERHRGERRLVAWARRAVPISLEDAWGRLMSTEGLLSRGKLNQEKEGDRYWFQTSSGQEYGGIVQVFSPAQDFSGTVEALNDALLRISIQSCGLAKPEAGIWLSTYGLPQVQVKQLEESASALLKRLF